MKRWLRWIAILATSLLVAGLLILHFYGANLAMGLIKQGDDESGYEHPDIKLLDYSLAILINPRNVDGYIGRGEARTRYKGDFDGAIADFTQAIQLDPASGINFLRRGDAKMGKLDFDSAIQDFDQGIKLYPEFGQLYHERGIAEQAQNKIPAAIGDFTHCIESNPRDRESYQSRAELEYINGQFPLAQEDFAKTVEIQPGVSYPQLMLWLVKYEEPAQRAKADKDLAAFVHGPDGHTDFWPAPIGRYLIGEIPEADFLKAAESHVSLNPKSDLYLANFFVATKHYFAGDPATAKAFLQKCRAMERPGMEKNLSLVNSWLVRLDGQK